MRWLPLIMTGWIVCGLPARALACSCLGLDVRLPSPGAVDVPLNTELWLQAALAQPPALTVANSGDPVPLTCVSLGLATRCRPDQDLLPQTRYRVEELGLEFTTGTTRDETAPMPPSESERRYYSSNGARGLYQPSCHTTQPEGAVELTLNGGDPILVVDASGGTDPAAPAGPVTEMRVVSGFAGSNVAWVGTWGCIANLPAEPGDRFPLRVGAFDMAGNFSGWVRLEDAAIPYAPPGCSSSTTDETLVALVWLAFVSARRRRSRRDGWCALSRESWRS